jgi:hypothetical protein
MAEEEAGAGAGSTGSGFTIGGALTAADADADGVRALVGRETFAGALENQYNQDGEYRMTSRGTYCQRNSCRSSS